MEKIRSRVRGGALRAAVLFLLLVSLPASPVSLSCTGAVVANADTTRTATDTIAVDVLANDVGPAGVALDVQVVSETCPGTVSVSFDTLVYAPSGALTSDCTITYKAGYATGSTTVWSNDAVVTVTALALSDEIFADGFESGGFDAWTSCVGCA